MAWKFAEKAKKLNIREFAEENVVNRKKFYSDAEVKSWVARYEKSVNANMFRRDSQSIRNSDKKKTNANKSITKRIITYVCTSGPERKPRGNGEREAFTSRMNCQGRITFSISECRKYYTITDMKPHDKHKEISKKVRKLLPQNRKLNDLQVEKIKEFHEMRGDKLLLMDKLAEMGNIPTFKDISNITQKLKKKNKGNSLTEALEFLKKRFNDENETFEALYMCSKRMQQDFESWPEYIAMDSTYKLLDVKYPVTIVIGTDGNGATRIFSIFIVKKETKEIIQWCFKKMQEMNKIACENVKVFMGDKDIVFREVLPKEMPQVPMTICIFHAQQIFRRILNDKDYNLSMVMKERALRILKKMPHAKSDSEYMQLYNNFRKLDIPQNLQLYFDSNWHDIRNQWVKCYMGSYLFKNDTNNRLESLNQKLNYMCKSSNRLTEFLKKFFDYHDQVSRERDTDSVKMFAKKPAYQNDLTVLRYYDLLTLYAYNHVRKQLKTMDTVLNVDKIEDGIYCIKSIDQFETQKYTTTTTNCTCFNAITMSLPCRHIFKVRNMMGLNLFEESLCNIRWTKKVYLQKNPIYNTDEDQQSLEFFEDKENNIDSLICEKKSKKVLDQQSANVSCVLGDKFTNGNQISSDQELQTTPIAFNKSTQNIVSEESEVLDKSVCTDISRFEPLSIATTVDTSSRKDGDAITTNSQEEVVLEKLSNPKGRPRGKALDAIGLPISRTIKCIPYEKMSDLEKSRIILKWILKPGTLNKKVLDTIFDESDFIDFNNMPCWIYDPDIDINIVKKRMDKRIFNRLKSVIKRNEKNVQWICSKCNNDLNNGQYSIGCDGCMKWQHYKCAGLKKKPKQYFFCHDCMKSI
ncbi:hypothetical protein TKK_0007694 [Trichogramma kaykai]|uniref:SWIM-type domain-containing protein n=1 Tax=Trichogramma kaykai TaxID=54128 RepID=A0ABD2X9E9_9HYME